MARPQIPDVIKNRIEEIHEQHRGYNANSFQEALSTVADLAEQTIRETELDEKVPFQYEIEDSTSGIIIHLSPEPESDIEYADGKLCTPDIELEYDEIFDKLKQIDGVRTSTSGVSPSESIKVIFREDPERSFNKIVDDVFVELSKLIQRRESTIKDIEKQAEQYASPVDSDNQ